MVGSILARGGRIQGDMRRPRLVRLDFFASVSVIMVWE